MRTEDRVPESSYIRAEENCTRVFWGDFQFSLVWAFSCWGGLVFFAWLVLFVCILTAFDLLHIWPS